MGMMDDVSNGMHNVSDGVRDMVDRNDEANTEDLTDNEYPRQEDVYTASTGEDVNSEAEVATDDGVSEALTQREEQPLEEEVVEEESPEEPLDSQDEPRV